VAVGLWGDIWFTENRTNRLAKLDPQSNTVTEWNFPRGSSDVRYLAFVPNGLDSELAFAEYGTNEVGYFNQYTNSFYEWRLPYCCINNPASLAVDGSGNFWFTENGRNTIGRLETLTNVITEWTLPASGPLGLWGVFVQQTTSFSSGASTQFIWFTEQAGNRVGFFDPSNGWLVTWDLNSVTSPYTFGPRDITVAPDGTVIFTGENGPANMIGVLDYLSGMVAVISSPLSQSQPAGVRWDSSRGLAWVAESNAGTVTSVDTSNTVKQIVGENACIIAGGYSSQIQACGSGAAAAANIVSPTVTSESSNQNSAQPTTSTVTSFGSDRFTEYSLPTGSSRPSSLAIGPDGSVWVAENSQAGNRIARLTITQPMTFKITPSPSSVTVAQGQLALFGIMVTKTGGNAEPVHFTVTQTPTFTATFVPSDVVPPFDAALGIQTSTTTQAGTYTFTVQAATATHTATSSVSVNVVETPTPQFNFTIAPNNSTAVSIKQGETASYGFSADQTAGTASATALNAIGAPPYAQAVFSHPSGTPPFQSTLTITTSLDTPANTYQLTVVATANAQTRSAHVTLTVTPQSRDIQLTVNPTSVNIVQAGHQTVTITLQSVGVFNGPVVLTAQSSPASIITVLAVPNVVALTPGGTATSQLLITAPNSVRSGDYSILVTATGGTLTKTASVNLSVSGCLIATATYGSAAAPEVQLLRDFRDRQILNTFAGANFMAFFNAWYYSFSPQVAGYENSNPPARAAMSYLLYPLIGVLHVSSLTYTLLGAQPEVAVIVAGLIATMSIGCIYLALPLTATLLALGRKPNRTTKRHITTALVACLSVSVCLLSVAELASIGWLAGVAGVAITLSALAAGTAIPAVTLLQAAAKRTVKAL
jgi:streptogramin lyase